MDRIHGDAHVLVLLSVVLLVHGLVVVVAGHKL